MRQRSNLDPQVDQLIRDLADTRWWPERVYSEVKARLGKLAGSGRSVVSKRTVESRLKEHRSRRGEDLWRPAQDASPDDARLVLDVVADVAIKQRFLLSPTKSQASHLARLRTMLPETPSIVAWRLARSYAEWQDDNTDDLDALLVFRPWLGEEQARSYAEAKKNGLIPRASRLKRRLGSSRPMSSKSSPG